MSLEDVKKQVKTCWEKEEPFCASSCPFHYDIREFTARLKRGSFNAAFRTFANSVGFPGIVAALCDQPCRNACPRQQTDMSIDMQRLERAALHYAANTKPNSYNLPPKQAKIAIVGAGLSGLGCALRLCNRKYQVTVFEQSSRIGGSLWQKLLPEDFMADIETQFMYEQYGLRLNNKVDDAVALLAEFDAVYIATGAGGPDFGLPTKLNPADMAAPYAAALPGVFWGGMLTGATDMEALAQGLQAASLIEAYLKTGNMRGAQPHRPTCMHLDPTILFSQPPEEVAGALYTKEQTLAESQRCLGCRCDACNRHCPLMHYFEKFPLRIEDEVAVTIDPGTLDGNGTVATRFISTCNQCGLCAEVCPQHIDMKDFLRQSHQAMRAKGAMPWAFHEFWLRDMARARGEAYALCASPVEQPHYLFFPGCQLAASEPQHVLGAYALLRQTAPDTGIHLGCCGAPAVWAGDEPLRGEVGAEIRAAWEEYGHPQLILACPTCRDVFGQYWPEIETVFLLDFLIEQGIQPQRSVAGTEIAVFDPCAMRHHDASRNNVRALAQTAGYTMQELAYYGERAQCCSFGGHMDIANPPYKDWLVKQRISASPLPYLVYCSNCRDIFAAEGKQVIHALELFAGCERQNDAAPSLEQRLKNRTKVKKELIMKYFPQLQHGLPQQGNLPQLQLAPGLAQKLEQERILLEDIHAVIATFEAEGRRLRHADGYYIGHAMVGNMTCWVKYMPEDGVYTVLNAYAHRMKIEGEG